MYSYTGDGDTPDLQLAGAGTIGERYISLAGRVLYTKRYSNPGGEIWALPNIHGDTLATTSGSGNLTGTAAIYDPFGSPLNPATGLADEPPTPRPEPPASLTAGSDPVNEAQNTPQGPRGLLWEPEPASQFWASSGELIQLRAGRRMLTATHATR